MTACSHQCDGSRQRLHIRLGNVFITSRFLSRIFFLRHPSRRKAQVNDPSLIEQSILVGRMFVNPAAERRLATSLQRFRSESTIMCHWRRAPFTTNSTGRGQNLPNRDFPDQQILVPRSFKVGQAFESSQANQSIGSDNQTITPAKGLLTSTDSSRPGMTGRRRSGARRRRRRPPTRRVFRPRQSCRPRGRRSDRQARRSPSGG